MKKKVTVDEYRTRVVEGQNQSRLNKVVSGMKITGKKSVTMTNVCDKIDRYMNKQIEEKT